MNFPYRRLFLVFLSVTSSMGVGDIICQNIQRNEPKPIETNNPTVSVITHIFPSFSPSYRISDSSFDWWSPHRTSIQALQGAIFSGPWGFAQFSILEHFFPGRSSRTVLMKVAASVAIAPISICLTFSGLNFLNGRSIEDAKKKILADLGPTYLSGALYWPIISFFNFKFTPLHLRPVVGSMAGVLWNIYLSAVANKKSKNKSKNESKTNEQI